MRKLRKAVVFSAIVCAVSWILAGLFYLLTKTFELETEIGKLVFGAFCTFYMFVPLCCALFVQWIGKEKPTSTGLLKFRINKVWIATWLSVPLIITAAIPVNALFSDLSLNVPEAPGIGSDGAFLAITLLAGLFAGISINAAAAFGEEYAWRNYLVSALKKTSFIKAGLFIGIVWGIWHFPLILMGHNYPEHGVAGVFMFCAVTVLLGFIEMYFVVKARSVYPAAIFHGTFNALAGIVSMFVAEPHDLLTGMPGVAGIITLLVACAVIFVYDRYISAERITAKTLEDSII